MNNMLLVWAIYQKIYGPAPCLWDAEPYFNEDTIEFRDCFSLKRFRKCPEDILPKILARFCAEC